MGTRYIHGDTYILDIMGIFPWIFTGGSIGATIYSIAMKAMAHEVRWFTHQTWGNLMLIFHGYIKWPEDTGDILGILIGYWSDINGTTNYNQNLDYSFIYGHGAKPIKPYSGKDEHPFMSHFDVYRRVPGFWPIPIWWLWNNKRISQTFHIHVQYQHLFGSILIFWFRPKWGYGELHGMDWEWQGRMTRLKCFNPHSLPWGFDQQLVEDQCKWVGSDIGSNAYYCTYIYMYIHKTTNIQLYIHIST